MRSAIGVGLFRVYGWVGHARIPLWAVLLVVAPSVVQGQTVLRVDAAAVDPVHDGSSWDNAFTNLQDALDSATVLAQGGTVEIWIVAGVYRPDRGTGDRTASFNLVNNVGLYGGFAGWETARDQADPVANETILNGDLDGNDDSQEPPESDCCDAHGNYGCDDSACEALVCEEVPHCCLPEVYGRWKEICVGRARHLCCELCRPSRCENTYHVLTAFGPDSSIVLDGLTISGGEANGDWPWVFGGGIYSDEATVTVTRCTFVDNAGGYAAAIKGDLGAFTLTDVLVLANDSFRAGAPVVRIHANEASVTRSDFIANRGGGLSVGWIVDTGHFQPIVDCRFIKNTLGGGLFLDVGAYADVRDCLFLHNTAASNGGGLLNRGTALLKNCAFIGNAAAYDGGGAVHIAVFGSMTLLNCLFTGNTAGNEPPPYRGTAGALMSGWGGVTAINCTFAGNSADWIGGMYAGYGATIRNCIFWGNSDDRGMGWDSQFDADWSAVMNVWYNSIQGWEGAWPTQHNVNIDPVFVDPLGPDGLVGTEDDDLRLSPDSPLINAADPTYIPASYETDLDGNPRLQACRVDMGAYEAQIEQLPGDYDHNGRVDLADLAGFQLCMGPWTSNPDWVDTCLCLFDADGDRNIDLHDFATFQEAFNSSE